MTQRKKYGRGASPAGRCKNKNKHSWVDDGKKDGHEIYTYTCRKCGKKKDKLSSFHAVYFDENGIFIGNRAPECEPKLASHESS